MIRDSSVSVRFQDLRDPQGLPGLQGMLESREKEERRVTKVIRDVWEIVDLRVRRDPRE